MDAEFKKGLNSQLWANKDPNKNRRDPESTEIDPVIIREEGFDINYSQPGGFTPDRRRINQILRELYGGLHEVGMGISIYDSEVNYPIFAITNINGNLYYASSPNGPSSTVVSPLDAGQTTWHGVSGSITNPLPPRDIVFDNSKQNIIDIKWKNGRDGGRRVEKYNFQQRIVGSQDWSSNEELQYAQHSLSGTSGTSIQIKLQSVTSHGVSTWIESTIGASGSNFIGHVPGGGDVFGLTATAGDKKATLNWTAPSDNGYSIIKYYVQWHAENEVFTTSNQKTTTNTSLVVSGLTNDTEYKFRVRAENSQGTGEWSNIAKATPTQPVIVAGLPVISAPILTANGGGYSANTRWSPNPQRVTSQPTQASWQERVKGTTTWSTISQNSLTGMSRSGLSRDKTYQVRYKLSTPIGSTDWSDYSSVKPTLARASAPRIEFGGRHSGGRWDNVWVRLTKINDGGAHTNKRDLEITIGTDSNNTSFLLDNENFGNPYYEDNSDFYTTSWGLNPHGYDIRPNYPNYMRVRARLNHFYGKDNHPDNDKGEWGSAEGTVTSA